ncbi:MAG: hypothetical protein WCF01_07955 [Nitrososphaeraceae archaeon]
MAITKGISSLIIPFYIHNFDKNEGRQIFLPILKVMGACDGEERDAHFHSLNSKVVPIKPSSGRCKYYYIFHIVSTLWFVRCMANFLIDE